MGAPSEYWQNIGSGNPPHPPPRMNGKIWMPSPKPMVVFSEVSLKSLYKNSMMFIIK